MEGSSGGLAPVAGSGDLAAFCVSIRAGVYVG
jgi:hypothetical protein